MSEFWEDMFQKIGLLWSFEPSDSAIFARDVFTKNGFHKILISGVGYGRNARIFVESGFEVTGIEISETAIQLARENGLDFPIHHESVKQMPFDKENDLSIPRSHNLIRLHQVVEVFLKNPFELRELMALDSVYTSSRYPSDVGMIAAGKPTQQDAQEFYESAKNIFEAITKLID